jgi:histidine ammonia-lyase
VKVREKVPMIKKDQPISNHIQAITDMVADGSLLEAVETDIGKLR